MIGRSYIFLSSVLYVSASIFFHEPSYIALVPKTDGDHTTFGFSLAYQQNGPNKTLVIGAPHSGPTGKVFECPFNNVLTEKTTQCKDVRINLQEIAPYPRDFYPDFKLNLGASVSAAPNYIFTCAPLWPNGGERNDAFGTCFTYNGTAHRYTGILEQYNTDKTSLVSFDDIKGGTGWKTLIDPANDVLLVAKVALVGDITFVNASQPLEPVRSFFSKNENRQHFNNYQNIGTSMVAGNFFDKKKILYAVNSYDSELSKYTIHFLQARVINKRIRLSLVKNEHIKTKDKSYVQISDETNGSLFGAAMCAADLDNDGFAELLVGAPAQADREGGYETGVLHIFLGGDIALVNDISRHCVVTSNKEGSRFGAAVAASDVDGDNLPEIFVSAPYEDNGEGALYILSGHEINRDLINKGGSIKRIELSSLKYTQRIQNNRFRTFGYSLQVVSDLDDNGCYELAVGSPGSDNIMLLRCLPAVKVDVYVEQLGEKIVKEQDDNFTLKVCIKMNHLKNKAFSTRLKIKNQVFGIAYIKPEELSLNVDVTGEAHATECRNITVHMTDYQPHDYTFYTKVEMDEGVILNSKDFNSTWATVSPNSIMERSIDISRHCKDKDCDPKLTLSMDWSGKEYKYTLGSSDSITVLLLVKNEGNSSFDSCVRVAVTGAPVAKIGCKKIRDEYKCFMPKPLRRSGQHLIEITFNMSQLTNLDNKISVRTQLFDFCDNGIPETQMLNIQLSPNPSDVSLTGLFHNQNISDTEIQDQNVPYVYNVHEYMISNNGSVYWKEINISVSMRKKPYLASYKVSAPMGECVALNMTNRALFNCILDLEPRSSVKIIASTRITKNIIMDYFEDNQVNVKSNAFLYLIPLPDIINVSVTSNITLQREQTLAQKKSLVIFLAVLGAAIALGVLVFIMYKMEFFKRKEQTKLIELKKELVRRKSSVGRSVSQEPNNMEGILDNMEVEVFDEDPFEIVDIEQPLQKPGTSKEND